MRGNHKSRVQVQGGWQYFSLDRMVFCRCFRRDRPAEHAGTSYRKKQEIQAGGRVHLPQILAQQHSREEYLCVSRHYRHLPLEAELKTASLW